MYLLFFDLYVIFWIHYKIKNVASLHDTRPALAAAGTLIIEVGQLEIVEAGMPARPWFMCDSGRAGARRKRHVKNPLVQVVVGLVSIRAHPRPR
jgi:hypothetical protein